MANLDIIAVGKQGVPALFWLSKSYLFNLTCNVTALILLCSAKFQHCDHSDYFVILKKVTTPIILLFSKK